jgi:hypothetical protein
MKTPLLAALCLMFSLQFNGCASSSQDRYEKLAGAEDCKASLA